MCEKKEESTPIELEISEDEIFKGEVVIMYTDNKSNKFVQ